MSEYENIEKVKRLDFDHLDMLVSERIGALKLLAQSMRSLLFTTPSAMT